MTINGCFTQKNVFISAFIIIFALAASGFHGSNIHMRVVMDGKPMLALKEIKGRCITNDSEVLLIFDAVNDIDERIADEETFFTLDIKIDDISQIPLGSPIKLLNSPDIHPTASAMCFCVPPLDPLTSARGRLTIDSFEDGFIDGTVMITFKDPGKVNSVVDNSLKFWIKFSKIICKNR